METPNPTMEEYRAIMESQSEELKSITPDTCPYFHAIIAETKSQNGVKIAWINHIQIIIGHAHAGNQQPATKLKRPDQIAILPPEGNEGRFTVASTHFFVTEDDALCCLAPSDKPAQKDIWVILESSTLKKPPSGTMGDLSRPYATIRNAVKARNQKWKVKPPAELREIIGQKWQEETEASGSLSRKLIESVAAFSLYTSQEMDALNRAQCDGRTGNGYERNDQAGAIIYYRANSSHAIRLELTEDERAAGLALDYLETLARNQDADAVLATSYILGVLAPPPHLPPRPYAGGWIDFNDTLKKIGWIPRNTKDRREMHARIWGFIKFGERAIIAGKRVGSKYEDADGNPIDTTIHGAAWRVMKTETPDPPTLYAALETPVRAEIVVSKELTALITHPKAAQYFQCAEILGAIAGGKPAGAWARVIGAALMSFWRRKPREYSAGTLNQRGANCSITTRRKSRHSMRF